MALEACRCLHPKGRLSFLTDFDLPHILACFGLDRTPWFLHISHSCLGLRTWIYTPLHCSITLSTCATYGCVEKTVLVLCVGLIFGCDPGPTGSVSVIPIRYKCVSKTLDLTLVTTLRFTWKMCLFSSCITCPCWYFFPAQGQAHHGSACTASRLQLWPKSRDTPKVGACPF